MADLQAISENLQKGKAAEVAKLVQAAVDEGVNVGEILDQALIAGMAVIGAKFKKNEVYVPEVLIAARAMNLGMKILAITCLTNMGTGLSPNPLTHEEVQEVAARVAESFEMLMLQILEEIGREEIYKET